MLSGSGGIDLDFTGPPFSDIELKDPHIKTILNSDSVLGGSTSFTVLYTTQKYHDANPIAYKAFVRALKDATDYINKDKARAAKIYYDSIGGKGLSWEDTLAMFKDSRNVFTMTPQNTMKYASFMYSIGSIKNQPKSWQDLFFPEVHELPGS